MMKDIELYPQQQTSIPNIASIFSFKLLVRSIVTLGICSGFTIPAGAQITGGDGTIVSPAPGTPNTFNITEGTQPTGTNNLFHSFGKFDLNSSQTANFQAGANVQNILGRINGGLPSSIDGKIQVNGGQITNVVNLYLMNPAGIVFGKNASLDINGAFTATTAKAIDFGNGNWFNALGANTYTELKGNPIGLAFPGSTPGSIFSAATFDASPLDPNNPARTQQTAKPGQSITLVGGTVISTGDIKTAGGNISIATVEGGKYVQIKTDGSILRLDLPASATNITSEAKAFTALSLPKLLTNTGIDLAATGVKNENDVVTLVGTPAAIKAATDRDKAQAVYNATKSFSDLETLIAGNKALEAVDTVGNPITIASDINLGDTVSKQNRPIASGDVITRNLDTSQINNGGNIRINSSQAILSRDINTNSQRSVDKANQIYRSGNVVLDAQTELKTKTIDSSTVPSFTGDIDSTGGNVTLSTQTKDIIVDSINTAAGFDDKLSNAQIARVLGGNVTIKAANLFRVISGGIDSSVFGIIDIKHGSKQPFASGVTFEPLFGGQKAIPKPGFTFPDGASGSRGSIVTSKSTNGSVGVVYIDGVFKDFKGNTVPGSSITAVPRTSEPPPENPKNNPDEQAARQKSKQDCTPSSTAVAANPSTAPNRSEGNASAPSADPCQLVTGTAGGTLQILNDKN